MTVSIKAPQNEFFRINKNEIQLASGTIDYEEIGENIEITIELVDRGIPSLSSELNVTFELLDVNDEPVEILDWEFISEIDENMNLVRF